MRRLLWFAVGFAGAAAAFAYLLSGGWVLCAATLLLLLFSFLFPFRKKIRPEVLLILAGLVIGLFYNAAYDQIRLKPAREADGQTFRVHITARDYSFDTGYGQAVDGKMRLYNKNYSVRLFYEGDTDIRPGDVLSVRAQMRYTPRGGLENATYHRGEGIFLLAYGQVEPVIVARESGIYWAAHIRNAVTERIRDIFPEDTAGFAQALLLGDDSQLSFAQNTHFQKSGIRHVIAVSGLHVSILFAVVYVAAGKRKWPALLAGLPVLLLFAAVAGFSPSVVRACIMQGLFILALALDRQYDHGTALSVACIAMLIGNPLVITSASFQLSVGCIIGIFLFYQPIMNYFHKFANFRGKHKRAKNVLYGWLTGSVAVSVSAMVFTLPLCAAYFGMVCAMGILTNFLVLWIIAFIFYGIMISCLVSVLWLPAGSAAAWVVSWAIRYVLKTAELLSRVPGAVAYGGSPYTVWWIILTVALIGVFFLCKKKYPVLLVSTVTLLYALSILATWAEPRLDNFRMTIVDVGQGQCVLLQSKDYAYLVDCGGEDPQRTAEAARNSMGAQGIRKLDGLILTHYDEDHCNGAADLISVMDIETLYLPDTEPLSDIRHRLRKQGVPVCWVKDNMELPCGQGKVSLFPAKIVTEDNESSMCILFQMKNCDILITGDRNTEGEQRLLDELPTDKVEILVVGHHGADTSTGVEFLEAIQPDTAIISVGKENFYGHPHSSTLLRLNWFGCRIRRTDTEGTIIIRG